MYFTRMYFTRILLSIVFVLFASTALAANPGKILVCHVGDDHGDLKVDLILASTKVKHLDNPSHSFQDGDFLWVDFTPARGIGIGDKPEDFEEGKDAGIDLGCEIREENLACPCWDGYTPTTLELSLGRTPPKQGYEDRVCTVISDFGQMLAYGTRGTYHSIDALHEGHEPEHPHAGGSGCTLTWVAGEFIGADVRALSHQEAVDCITELAAVKPALTWCP